MSLLLSLMSALASAGVFYLTGLYTAWYWYFLPLILFIPFYVVSFVLVVLFVGFIGLFFSKKKPVEKPHPWFYMITVSAIRQVLMILRIKVRVSGLDKLPKENFVAVYNHISAFDPLVLLTRLPVKRIVMMSKPENEKLPIVGKYMHMSGFPAIDRKSPMKARRTVEKCADWVRDGVASVAISPEGTRSKTGELLSFRAAPFSTAKKADCPIVVIVVRNTDKVFKKFPLRTTVIDMDVIDTVMPETYHEMTSFELSDHVRTKMLDALGQEDKHARDTSREEGSAE